MGATVVKEVLSYYKSRNTNVFDCSLDASKAFDCVRYDKLFTILLKRNVPATAIRSFLDAYRRER